jgi:hypothetical protein
MAGTTPRATGHAGFVASKPVVLSSSWITGIGLAVGVTEGGGVLMKGLDSALTEDAGMVNTGDMGISR